MPGFGEALTLNDTQTEIAALAHKWDKQNLLLLHKEPIIPYHRVKVFNCYKDDRRDRQIGDRRGRNLCEKALRGPSSSQFAYRLRFSPALCVSKIPEVVDIGFR